MNVGMELHGWQQLDADLRRAPELVQREMLAATVEADQLLEREVKDLMPTATGVSRASVFSREQFIEGGVLGVVGTALPHVVYLELGTKPHFPPILAIEDWVRVKFGLNDEKKIYAAALAIARKIAQRGTLGVGMFHRTWARQKPQVVAMYERALARIQQQLGNTTS